MDSIYLFIALIACLVILGGLNILQVILHYREKGEIFNRFMATDYREYQYHKKEYEVDVDHKEKTYGQMEKEKEKELSPLEIEARKKAGEH